MNRCDECGDPLEDDACVNPRCFESAAWRAAHPRHRFHVGQRVRVPDGAGTVVAITLYELQVRLDGARWTSWYPFNESRPEE